MDECRIYSFRWSCTYSSQAGSCSISALAGDFASPSDLVSVLAGPLGFANLFTCFSSLAISRSTLSNSDIELLPEYTGLSGTQLLRLGMVYSFNHPFLGVEVALGALLSLLTVVLAALGGTVITDRILGLSALETRSGDAAVAVAAGTLALRLL